MTSENEEKVLKLERALKEAQLRAEDATRELESITYSISHDVRAPLRAISGFSSLLLEDYGADLKPEAMDSLTRIIAGVKKMEQLIDSLLELSRHGRIEPVNMKMNLSDVVEQVASELKQKEPNRRVDTEIAKEIFVEADPRVLRVVMTKLLDNAWKFTSKKEQARIEFGVRQGGDGKPTFFVRDNGIGFDPKQASKLFGAFQRLHPHQDFPGTGIGLAITKRLIHRHGGKVWAVSEPDQGACFFFTL